MFMKCSPQRCESSSDPPTTACIARRRGRTHLGLIRILAELAPRFPLAQQIPALIELDFDGLQAYQFALSVEMLLLVNRTLNLLQDGKIGRRFSHVNHLAYAPRATSRCAVWIRTCGRRIARGKRLLF